MTPPLLLVAHGSRSDAADAVVQEIAAAARARLRAEVRVAYVDVRRPSVLDAVEGLAEAVVLPAFLASGYHVRTDLPAQLAMAGVDPARFVLTPALGPDPLLVRAALARSAEAGHRIGDTVVLAAAGSSDPAALDEVRTAGRMLSEALGRPVRVGFAATAMPRIVPLVESLRASGVRRVSVVSWLLAPGVFHHRLLAAGADVVGAPLGAHPAVVDAVVARYRAGVGAVRTAA
ncbi:sirohydrochlorin chelatase [Pseudonocardia oroxyli]|uniref:Sirohydrochlorin ferrochelatase n=1 Tax=Pseudonocardia oroxyli TaxID=366584 RepID=A0A1G8ALI7_PSEOR|nr:CbiX/SirB N-terminal domain-containing protein [Pseudonocardia oroxyli]SDH21798.1 Sirohydrochlorin ferrochelatase [Pseudonocardia oroxyli]